MYNNGDLKNLVHNKKLTQKELLLIALGCNGGSTKTAGEIITLLVDEGGVTKKAANIPVSSRFNKPPIWAVSKKGKWELNNAGVAKLKELGLHTKSAMAAKADDNLGAAINGIANEDTKTFVDEALQCYRHEFYRAATVLSWVGAMHSMFVYVHANKLTEFNLAAKARFHNPPHTNWKDVKTVEGFANMKEANFLTVMADLQLLAKSVKKKLDAQLDLRNGCGHPNDMVVGEHEVAVHLETLIGNVFKKFS